MRKKCLRKISLFRARGVLLGAVLSSSVISLRTISLSVRTEGVLLVVNVWRKSLGALSIDTVLALFPLVPPLLLAETALACRASPLAPFLSATPVRF